VSEENGLNGARAFDISRLRSQMGFVFDHATPIGEVVVASPTFYRLHAAFRGAAAHAGIRPEAGRSAILAAAKAIAVMPHGRIDDETTANVGTIAGGAGGTNVVAERCWFDAEARSLSDAAVETLVAEMVDHCHDAANDPVCECDVDVTVERVFTAYRQRTTAPGVLAAEAALRACNYTPRRILSGGGSDANAFEAKGFHCINLANGTEHNHESSERVSQVALEGMLDVTFALLDELAEG
jgi:tripeptide aminopeptidase